MKFFVTGVNGFRALPTWQDAVSRYLKEAQL